MSNSTATDSTEHTAVATASQAGGAWLRQSWRVAPVATVWALLAPLVAGALFIPQAWWLASVLQQAIVDKVPVATLQPTIWLIAGLLILRALISCTGERCASVAAEAVKHRLRSNLLHTLLQRGPFWTRQHPLGELATAVIDHVEALDGYLQRYMAAAMAAVFLPLLFVIAVFGVDWIVGVLLLCTAPLIPLFMALVGWGAESANQKHQRSMQCLSGVFGDRIRGLFTLTLFGQTDREVAAVRQSSVALGQTTMKVLRIAFISSAVLELFAALGVAGVAVYIGLSYLGMLGLSFSGFSLQHGLFCLFIAPEFYQPLRQLAASYHDRAQAKSAVNELEQLLGDLPSLNEAKAFSPSDSRSTAAIATSTSDLVPTDLPSASMTAQEASLLGQGLTVHPAQEVEGVGPEPVVMRVENLSLSIPDGTVNLLQNQSFTLYRGDSVALVGESGSGKTTLLESIIGLRPRVSGTLHFYPQAGSTAHTRTHDICFVGSTPFVAIGTVADALRLANPAASDQQLWQALEAVQLSESVRSLPEGLMAPVGKRGFGLSGGQIHRLALARLFLTDASLVLLDEPTAHLDGQTRDAVLEAILAFCADRALVIATHDPVVAQRLDQQWQLQDAQLVGAPR